VYTNCSQLDKTALFIKVVFLTFLKVVGNIIPCQNSRLAILLFYFKYTIYHMTQSKNKKLRKNKLQKAKEAKRVKTKINTKKRLNGKADNKAKIKHNIDIKITALTGAGVILLFLFLLMPLATSRANNSLMIKVNTSLAINSNLNYPNSLNPYLAISEAERRKQEVPKSKLYKEVYSVIKGTPMEKMIDDIADRDRPVAAFIVGIAMKESKFGKFSPKKEGVECYNYWGYRGSYNQTDSGYSCFDSPEQAVKEVGGKIEKLLAQNINTPSEMVVWKCGSSCARHDPGGVKKWISDVDYYYQMLN